LQDVAHGGGMMLIDPHCDLPDPIARHIRQATPAEARLD
jgi:hypothetical protein